MTSLPVPLSEVISPAFLICLIGFLVLVFTGFLADGWIARRPPHADLSGMQRERVEDLLVRVSMGGYSLLLWNNSAVVPWGHTNGAVLAPELLLQDWPTSVLQLAVTLCVLRRESCGVAGLAVLMLFVIGTVRYGLFHMTDYTFFLGHAAYLALASWPDPRLDHNAEKPARVLGGLHAPSHLHRSRSCLWIDWVERHRDPGRWRMPLLIASLAFSLMWVAIEKFLYPQWSAQVLILHPRLTFGLPLADVVRVAGFVEFSLAFYLVTGRGLLRFAAIVLMAIFISAMPEFGRLDVVGHMPMIAILLLVALRGGTPLHHALRLRRPDLLSNATAVCGLYVLTLAGMMALYYGLQLTARV